MWLHMAKSSLWNWYLNHFVLSIEKRLITETFENKSVKSITKERTEYQITISKATEKASLMYQKLKKTKNWIQKKLRS